jgi:hypothetical protein
MDLIEAISIRYKDVIFPANRCDSPTVGTGFAHKRDEMALRAIGLTLVSGRAIFIEASRRQRTLKSYWHKEVCIADWSA